MTQTNPRFPNAQPADSGTAPDNFVENGEQWSPAEPPGVSSFDGHERMAADDPDAADEDEDEDEDDELDDEGDDDDEDLEDEEDEEEESA